TRPRGVSALPFAAAGAATGPPSLSSITLTSTTVSSAVSLRILTSTWRRLSWSSINAASTASSRVRPRPSAVFTCDQLLGLWLGFLLLLEAAGDGAFWAADGRPLRLPGSAFWPFDAPLAVAGGAPPTPLLNRAGKTLSQPTTKLC